MTTAADEAFLRDFESGQIDTLDHRSHVRLAFMFLKRSPMGIAGEELSAAICQFAERIGKPDLFHATITWAYVLLIHERMRRCQVGSFEEFAEANPDLLRKGHAKLLEYYEPEVLKGDLARRVFVMPPS